MLLLKEPEVIGSAVKLERSALGRFQYPCLTLNLKKSIFRTTAVSLEDNIKFWYDPNFAGMFYFQVGKPKRLWRMS